jgi:hypothetical protein
MSTKALCAAIAVLAVAGGAGSVALATIPDGAGVIHGCYSTLPPTGQLRVIDTDKARSCGRNEKPLDWNVQGRPGATGPAGPSGTSIGWFTAGSGTISTSRQLASLSLPAGTFMVTLTGEGVDSLGDPDGYVRVGCLVQGTDIAAPLYLKGQGGSLAGSGVVTLAAPTALAVDCNPDPFDPGDPPFVRVELSAIQVDKANVQ